VLEVIPQNVGFRKVEIRGGRFLINGKAILVKGVNRHEHARTRQARALEIHDQRHPAHEAVQRERGAHQPLSERPAWYDLADRYGMYVLDEANLECHHYGNDPENRLTNDPAWKDAYLDRQQSMVERDKNHPSRRDLVARQRIGDGPNAAAAYQWTKQRDPSRPFHYEGTTSHGGSMPTSTPSCTPRRKT
jgi:beta-galactosidase